MQMPVFLVLFLAPVYVPLALLSGWVEAVAKVNPFTALIEGGRDLISGQPFDAWLAYGIAFALARGSRVGGARAAEGGGGGLGVAADRDVNGGWEGGFAVARAERRELGRIRHAAVDPPTQRVTSPDAAASSPRRRIPSLR